MNGQRDERDKQYGGFSESMEKSARIATILLGKHISTEDFFKCMLALKLGRLASTPKYDSMVDLIGYTEGWWNYLQDLGEDEFTKQSEQ